MTFRPPLIQPRQTPRFVPSSGQGRVGATGIDVQFGGPGQWRTYDWPLPRARIYPGQLRTHIQNVNIQLIGKDVQFGAAGQFKSYDWPLPRPYVYPNQTRTWLLNAQIQLIGKDVQFGVAGQFKSYDWPLPRTTAQGNTWTLSLNQTTLAPAITLPFSQTDWPLPKVAQTPGKTWTYTLTPTVQAPFSQTDWSIPRATPYPAQNRTWLDQVKLNLIGLDQFFGEQGQGQTYDWQTPRTAVRLQDYSWVNNLSQGTLAPFIEPMPFNLYDWPLPRTPLPLVDLRSSTQGSGFPDQIPPPVQPIPIIDISDQPSNWQADYWKHRTKKQRKDEEDRQRIELGILPPELQAVAEQAVSDAVSASTELAAGRVEPQNAIAVAMQAREEYDSAYKQAYKGAYIAEVVAELWKEDVKRAQRRRAVALLLLN